MINLEQEAKKYDLPSLVNLQDKRKENINIFEQSIKNERAASQQEEFMQSTLENKIRNHDLNIAKLSDTEREWILSDLPKIKSTRENRDKTITLLKTAILEEYDKMDHESRMIMFLQSKTNVKE
jgi:hypothetical protein